MRFSLFLSAFIISLFASVFKNIPLMYPLLFGLLLFSYDALKKGFTVTEIFKMCGSGIKVVKNLIIIFSLVGILTASWRLSGTIPFLVYYGANLIHPKMFYLFAFLLTMIMSLLIGSVNGTVTTMGVVIISLARANGANLLITTGAILSGSMYGDRISPVSSSANLVADLTKTDVVKNRKLMFDSSIFATILTCIIYLAISIFSKKLSVDENLLLEIKNTIDFNILSILPAAIIIILAFMKLNTKLLLSISSIAAVVVAYFAFSVNILTIIKSLFYGINIGGLSQTMARIINGGGIFSMLNTIINVMISAMYYGIFEKTDFLSPIVTVIDNLENKIGEYGTFVVISILFSILFGTQSIVVMLLFGIYEERAKDRETLMLDLENVAILVPALIPWNMAAFLAFSVYKVEYSAVFFNFFCMLVPLTYKKIKKCKKIS